MASLDDALIAAQSGANRLELNSGLEVGGLTPSLGCTQLVLRQISIPVVAMSRPRPSGFHYSRREFATMLRDAEILLDAGVHGVAFGVLNEQRQIDADRCKQIVKLIGTGQAVFHRAFDLAADRSEALETLVDCGVTRLMTSGGQATAWQGIREIARVVELAGERIEVIAAGGIRPDHVVKLISGTGATQIHAGLGDVLTDPTEQFDGAVNFYADSPRPEQYRRTSRAMVSEMADQMARLP